MCVCEPRAHPSSTNRRVDHFHPMGYLLHFPTGIVLLHATKKNNNAAKFFVSLKQNNNNYSEGLIGTP